MVHSRRRQKKSIRYQQFQQGYAKVPETQLRALLEGYRLGHIRRNEIRVFAAGWEFASKHPSNTKLTLNRIVNSRSKRPGNRRLTDTQIAQALAKLREVLPVLQERFDSELREHSRIPEEKPVARRVLQHIARGGSTSVEALFCFAYFMRRIPQRKRMQRLLPDEHYARFRYADFESWTGVHRSTQSRILARLVDRGYIDTVPVHKQNENAYGQLFVDGPMLSLVRLRSAAHESRHARRVAEKMSSPHRQKVKAPPQEKSTLRNVNPKTEIEEHERRVLRLKEGRLAQHADPELRRIAIRAAQMTEVCLQQAA